MNVKDLKNPELQKRLQGAKTPEEILALAKEEGYELTDNELEQISGGAWSAADQAPTCPYCGQTDVFCYSEPGLGPGMNYGSGWECRSCGETWAQ